MGIKNLNSILKIINFPTTKIKNLQNSSIAIDFSLFMFRFTYNLNNPLECFLKQLSCFLQYNILPIYVIDGYAPYEKKNIIDKRIDKRRKNSIELSQLLELKDSIKNNNELNKEIIKLEKRTALSSKSDIKIILDFFDLCNIPYIKEEKYESDWVLAKLNQHNLVDYILTEDSDVIVFGANKVLKNFSLTDETVNIYELNKIIDYTELDYGKFVDMCILCGCDYTPRIKNISCLKSFELIKKHGSIEEIKIEYPQIDINDINSARNIFKKPIEEELIEKFRGKIKRNINCNNTENYLLKHTNNKFIVNNFLKSCLKFTKTNV